MDSKLVVQQMTGAWKVKNETLAGLAAQARDAHPPRLVSYTWVPRKQNSAADALANQAMDTRKRVHKDHEAAVGQGQLDLGVVSSPAEPVRAPLPPGAARQAGRGAALTLVLVRHGTTAMTVAGAYSGSGVPGPSLNARGRTESALAADIVYEVGRDMWRDLPIASILLTSPMIRTQETADVLGRRLGLTPQVEPGVREVDYGAWEGFPADEIERRWPGMLQAWRADPDVRAPEGESVNDVAERLRSVVGTLMDDGVDRTVVIASHLLPVRAMIGMALDAPPKAWPRIRVTPGSVSIVRFWSDFYAEVVTTGWPVDT